MKALALAALLLAFVTGLLLGRATADGAELEHAETPALWVAVHPTTTTTAAVVETTTTSVPGEVPVGPCGGWENLLAVYFPTDEIPTACAVLIQCESGGNPSAVSATGDFGLAQINEATWNKPGHPDPVADWIGVHWDRVLDPAINIQMAQKIWSAYGWSMWTCYR